MRKNQVATCGLVAALIAGGCTNVVLEEGGNDMIGDRRMLDQPDEKKSQLGQKLILDWTNAKVLPGEAGKGQVKRIVPGWRVASKAESSPEDFTLGVDAFPITNWGTAGNDGFALLYARLQFGSGQAQHGTDSTTTVTGLPASSSQILVDILNGTTVSLPGSFFQIDFQMSSFVLLPGFLTNDLPGPNFQVNGSLAYQPKVNVTRPTFTTPMVAVGPEPLVMRAAGADVARIVRPMYAKEIEFTWQNYAAVGATPAAGPLRVQFVAIQGGTVVAAYKYLANVNPPPRIPWPVDAQFVQVQNDDPANDMVFCTARNYLDL